MNFRILRDLHYQISNIMVLFLYKILHLKNIRTRFRGVFRSLLKGKKKKINTFPLASKSPSYAINYVFRDW